MATVEHTAEKHTRDVRDPRSSSPQLGRTGAEDEPIEEGESNDVNNDDGHNDASAQSPFEPKAPERSPAPAVFKAWRQENYGTMMMQAVIKDDAEALIWMLKHNLIDLAATDDLGNTAAHLAVFHDSPRVLRLLHELGLDLAATCDCENFGSAIFYSVYLGRVECLEELIALGYDMSPPCDRFGRTPEMVAERHDQGAALALVRRSLACLDIQRLARGFLGRQKAKRIEAAWARGEKKEAKRALGADGGGGEIYVVAGGGNEGGKGAEVAVGGGDGAAEG